MSAIEPPSLWPTMIGSLPSSCGRTSGRTSSASSWKNAGVRGRGGGSERPCPKRENAITRRPVAACNARGKPRQSPTDPSPSWRRTRARPFSSPGSSTASSRRPATVSDRSTAAAVIGGARLVRVSAGSAQLRLLGVDVDPVQLREVLAEDLALGLLRELRVAALLDDVPGKLEVPELLERPLRMPDRRLPAVEDLVLPAPPHHLPEHLLEGPRLPGDEVHRRGDRGVEVGVTHDLPEDLVEPREPDVD